MLVAKYWILDVEFWILDEWPPAREIIGDKAIINFFYAILRGITFCYFNI